MGENSPRTKDQHMKPLPSRQQGTPFEPGVRIFTLGRFEITRRVSSNRWLRVPSTEWRTARARRLLALLLSSAARRAQREQVMDALWPDLDIANASDHLDRGAHELRRVLEPQRGAYTQAHLLT